MGKLTASTLESVRKGCRFISMDPYAPLPIKGVRLVKSIRSQGENCRDINPIINLKEDSEIELQITKAREGSYARAKPTAATKDIDVFCSFHPRVFERPKLKVVEEDCGTADGLEITVDDSTFVVLGGQYIAETGEEITAEWIRKNMGGKFHLRTTMYCKSKDGYCKKCLGKTIVQVLGED